MTTAPRKIDLRKAALLSRLSHRIHDLEMERLAKEITAKEYKAIRANLDRQVEAIQALAA